MRSTSRCADCWTRFALLALHDPASSGRDRARIVSLQRLRLSYWSHSTQTSTRTYKDMSISKIIMYEPTISSREGHPGENRGEYDMSWKTDIPGLFTCQIMSISGGIYGDIGYIYRILHVIYLNITVCIGHITWYITDIIPATCCHLIPRYNNFD